MKKRICLFLCVLLAVSALSACSKKEEQTPEQTPFKITYDAAYSNYDDSVKKEYTELCSAVLRQEDFVRMNVGLADSVLQLYYTSFPLRDLASPVQEEDNSGMKLVYKYDSATHMQRVEDFSARVKEIVTECYAGTVNKNIYALHVYEYVCTHYTAGESDDIYDALVLGKGSDAAFCGMFEFLLLQADIPAYHIIADSSFNGTLLMSAAELDGSYYYFDTITEAVTSKGKLLRYYGMTTSDLADIGITAPVYTNRNAAAEATDPRFDTCRNGVGWSIEGSSLLVTIDSETAVDIPL